MRTAFLATFLLCCAVILPLSLSAQEIRSPYRFLEETQSLGLYGGYLFTNPGTPEVGPVAAPIFGIRYNLRFTGPLSGEAALSLVPSERQIIASPTAVVEPAPTGETVPMNLLIAEGGLRFHLTGARAWRNVAPYVLASGGVAADLSGRSAADDELPEAQRFRFGPSFAVGLGAGTDWFVAERVSLRLEVRDHILRLRVPGGLLEAQQAEAQWTNNFAISLGTALHF